MTQLSQKTILLTGAAGGFGEQFTRQLLSRDNALILTDLNEQALSEKAAAIHKEVGRGQIVGCIGGDLSTREGAEALFERVQAFGRPIDVLINNAGIGLMGRHDEVPAGAWERLMQVNLLAPMRLCALIMPQMIERQQGHIVNIASLAAWIGIPGLSAYVGSKFGLRGFSETLAQELNPHHVQVSIVCPFYSRTPIMDSPSYGSLADAHQVPEDQITDPADVIRETIEGIEKNKLHIFPDATARFVYRLKRYAPNSVFNFVTKRLAGG